VIARILFVAVAALVGVSHRGVQGQDLAPRSAAEFFESSIRPILSEECQKCHGPAKQSSGLRLDSREAILKGGDTGAAIVPGKPAESLLVQAVEHSHDELKMPPKRKLSAPQIAALRRWVELGAPWGAPVSAIAARSGSSGGPNAHWAFSPLRKIDPPSVPNSGWIRTPIDALVLARLQQEGLNPSPIADRRTLIRRATLDLLGIPPTAEEVEAFAADQTPDAFERLIDRLLASPLYGERWGRHWLDVARYADTKGYVFMDERKYPFAYTYRDYVIRAFNADLPFDQFVLQQVAADQLDLGSDPGPLAAMGFLTVGRRFLNDQNEIIDDRIDVIGRGLLGLTIGCARCHEHKFDPIPSEDYYSLYGVFASSIEPDDLPRLDPPGAKPDPVAESHRQELEKARKDRADFLAVRRSEIEKDFRERLSLYLRGAYDLELNPRNSKLDERAAALKLVPQRLRTAIVLWRRRLDAADASVDPILGPLRRFSALPKENFSAQAADLTRSLSTKTPGTNSKFHPLVARLFRDQPPTSMEQVVARYVELVATLEKQGRSPVESEWESLRRAFFGAGGLATIPADGARLVLSRTDRQRYAELDKAVKELEAKTSGKAGRAMVMRDAPKPVEPQVFIRGNPGRPGKQVPRQFLKALSGPDRRPFQKGSGRLELAQAIVDRANPLTARVLVNRVWLWHFGQGLVTTPSDFGFRSDPPSHPELLDYLATSLIDSGWSIKALHRRIMLSSTYQQVSDVRPDCLQRDPQNRLLWRFNRQRLDFESLRDSILAVAGTLDQTERGPSVALTQPPFPSRRTVYGFVDRQNLEGDYRTFDFAVPDATSPRRFVTTVPQQALFLLNSPFVQEQVRALAVSIEKEGSLPADDCVRLVYRRVLGRLPEPHELALGAGFLNRKYPAPASLSPLAQFAQVLILTNEFTFVD
jgi:hypothetical protein